MQRAFLRTKSVLFRAHPNAARAVAAGMTAQPSRPFFELSFSTGLITWLVASSALAKVLDAERNIAYMQQQANRPRILQQQASPSKVSFGTTSSGKKMPATADLCDDHEGVLQVADANAFTSFGQHITFGGEIVTIKCFENNPLVRSTLSEPGAGRVLVVDGGGSLRRALFGDNIAALAVKNGWAGVIIYGAIRDSEQIDEMPLGVKALGTNPIKSSKMFPGEKDVKVSFAGVTFIPGQYVYADQDGVVVSEKPLH